jgi:Protein of unknown function (DUF3499)
MRVSGACPTFAHDSLSGVNVPRRCSRPGCPLYAVATLTFVYSDSTAVVGPLATVREPHSWDLCVGHASRITAPRGWELVRHAGPLNAEPIHPDEDDLVALADAVREGGNRAGQQAGNSGDVRYRAGGTGAPLNGFADPGLSVGGQATAPSSGLVAPPEQRSGRRRGHLRVLPDPSD